MDERLKDKRNWPTVTAWVSLPIGHDGANPVTLGVGTNGKRVGYYSGGAQPADGSRVELWLKLDPAELIAMVAANPDAPPSIRGDQIIATQERTIARYRAEVGLLEDRELQLNELVVERFNPPDDDSMDELNVIGAAADFIEAQACVCGSFVLEDGDPCARCRVLGRLADVPVSR